MSMTELSSISIVVFSILVTAGAIMGFVKAKSKASLIAGIVSAIAFMYCYWLAQQDPYHGFRLAVIFIGVLEGIFLVRLMKTKKFMPSGLMLILCLTEQIVLLLNIAKS